MTGSHFNALMLQNSKFVQWEDGLGRLGSQSWDFLLSHTTTRYAFLQRPCKRQKGLVYSVKSTNVFGCTHVNSHALECHTNMENCISSCCQASIVPPLQQSFLHSQLQCNETRYFCVARTLKSTRPEYGGRVVRITAPRPGATRLPRALCSRRRGNRCGKERGCERAQGRIWGVVEKGGAHSPGRGVLALKHWNKFGDLQL